MSCHSGNGIYLMLYVAFFKISVWAKILREVSNHHLIILFLQKKEVWAE